MRILAPGLTLLFLLIGRAAWGDPAGHAQAMSDAKRAVRAGELDEALRHCRAAAKSSADDDLAKAEAWMLCGDILVKQKNHADAAKRYRDAAHMAIEDRRVRARALQRRRRALTNAKRTKSASAVGALLSGDQRVRIFERYPRRNAKKAEEAARELGRLADTYRGDRDRVFADYAQAVRALVLARSGREDEGRAIADKLDSSASRRVREIALKARYYALSAGEDVEASTVAAIRFNHVASEGLEASRRTYNRTEELEQACRRYEKANETGDCSRLQMKVVKSVAITDFSRGRRRSGALDSSDLDRVHHQVHPWLESCVLDAARADRERFRGSDLTISWVVDADGKPSEIAVKPKRYVTDLATCLEQVVPMFRYPKVQNQELSSVAMPFSLD